MSAQAAVARALMSAFADAGVEHVVLSPGSRSTPFVLAAACEERLSLHDLVDERVAAFFCLGVARVTGRPALMLTTSGSASAHALPAVLEAEHAGLPFVVVSADRPARLHACGANQTMEQGDLFGRHARLALRLPEARVAHTPPGVERLMRVAARQAAQLVAASLRQGGGPVHLDAPAEKSLEPPLGAELPAPPPAPRFFVSRAEPSPLALDTLAARLLAARRGLLLAGPGPQPSDPALSALVRDVCEAFGFTLAAESTSGLRFAAALRGAPQLSHADALFRDASGRRERAPDLVLALHQFPIRRGLAELMREGDAFHAAIAERGLPDPEASLDLFVEASTAAVLRGLLERAPARVARDEAFHADLLACDAALSQRADDLLAAEPDTLTPQGVIRDVAACVPGLLLGLGNGLTVRRADDWISPASDVAGVLHQRGLSGIDGGISGVAGAAMAHAGPVALLIGDVAFRHDVSGLAAAAQLTTPLAIVVIDDGGGRIFAELPIGERADLAEQMHHFTTPGPSRAQQAAALYDLPFAAPRTRGELGDALEQAMLRGGASVILAELSHEAGARLDHALRMELP